MNRKVLKKRGLDVLVRHYWTIVIIMALCSFIGVENASSFGNLKNALSKNPDLVSQEISTSILDERFTGFMDIAQYISNGFGTNEVWDKSKRKIQSNLQEGEQKLKETLTDTLNGKKLSDGIADGADVIVESATDLKDNLADIKDVVTKEAQTVYDDTESEYLGPVEIGKSQGVFAGIVNSLTSGKFVNKVFTGIATIFRSDDVAAVILIVLIILLSIFLWSFVARVFVVIARRFTLEARTYEVVPARRILFLIRSGRWLQTAWGLFTATLITSLWSLTVIGGFIKYYEYLMVPYILAENPSVSAKEARTLSSKMMKGHKWEAFKLSMSFLGWRLLSLLTFGLLELFFVNAYEVLTFAEYYAELRQEVKKKKKAIPEAALLNDALLYVKPDDDIISEAYADIMAYADEKINLPVRLKGISGFFARNFGVVLFADKNEERLCEYEEHQQKVKTRKYVFEKRIYPFRLFPAYRKTFLNHLKPPKIEYLHYVRRYSIWSMIIMFFIFSFIGWLWEIGIHLYEDGVFVNRGFLKGPYLPIYGGGSLVILIILNKFRKKPIIEFLSIIVLSGILEYTTSAILEYLYDQKWWDYSGYFLNIRGRICAEGLLVFAIFGSFMVYILAPLTDNILRKIKLRIIAPICIVLLVIFMVDLIYSGSHPNTGAGITDYPAINHDGTG
ncbi:MAG: DUF975 family protein [Lachnospiraceae bacterium]|nr:DUF975 family protein [Lachnospiraceae bacterium]